MKRVLAVLLSAVLSLSVAVVPGIQTLAEEPDAAQKTEGQQEAEVEVQAPSAVLMEASTGAVLYEKDADTRRAPASVTKIMTMLLIFDALEDGKLRWKMRCQPRNMQRPWEVLSVFGARRNAECGYDVKMYFRSQCQ